MLPEDDSITVDGEVQVQPGNNSVNVIKHAPGKTHFNDKTDLAGNTKVNILFVFLYIVSCRWIVDLDQFFLWA